jgi:hypothetical protein
MTQEEFVEKHIPKQGEIIEYDGVEYMVHDSNRVGSQFLNQEALSEESYDAQYEAISTADQIPFYNLDPVQVETVYNLNSDGTLDQEMDSHPIFNIPLTALLQDGFTKTGKTFDYEQYKNAFGQGSLEQDLMFQKAEMPASKASKETLDKLKQVASNMGVKMQSLSDYLKGNPDVEAKDVNALADLLQGIIAIAEGKEDVAFTEEIIHVATAMIEQVDPKLITEMISKITRFKIYQKTLDAYKTDPNYQLPNGKPDIRKIKKEAVDKLIAELIIKQSEGSTEFPELLNETDRSMVRNFWNTILDWFRGMYKASNINVFEQAATKIAAGDIGMSYARKQEGLDYIFEQNPELANIGTQEQYSMYIDRIFPNSEVKQIVYHGTGSATKLESLTPRDGKVYFSDDLTASRYADWDATNRLLNAPEEEANPQLVAAVINLENPTVLDGVDYTETETNKEGDGIIGLNIKDPLGGLETQYVVRDASQIHVLGSQQDVANFKEFMKTAPAIFKGEGVYFQKLSPAQVEIQKRIQNTKDSIEKREESKSVKADPLLMDTEEASNYYMIKNPDGTETRITKRVTDRVKEWYRQRFGDKTFSESEKEFNEFKRTLGVKYHHFFEEIHGRYFNSDGTRKTKVEPRPRIINSVDEEVYDKLEQYYVDLIAKFSQKGKNPLVFSEVILYDAKEKEAGTIDLLIVEENGKANIFDWKFMSVSANANDVPWYKQGAYNIQLGRYKDMLMDAYGVKEFGMNRAIPILMEFRKKNTTKKDNLGLSLSGIAIGTIDSNKIEDMRLVPISEESESTGNEDLDNLLSELNSIYKQISKTSATSDEEREYKNERLNVLKEAIRAAHASQNITPLINVIKVMRKEGQDIINDWETIYDKKAASSDDFDNPSLSDYAEDIREYLAIANVFVNVDKLIGNLIWNKDMEAGAITSGAKKNLEYRKKVLADINQETKEIFESVGKVKKIAGSFANKFMGERNLVTGLLKTDAIWKGLGSFFRGAAEAPLASVKILYKLVNNAKGRASADALEEINDLLSIRKKLADRGGDLRKLVQQIYQKDDKNNLVNKLIYKYQKAFYDAVDNNAAEGKQDKNWLMQNIDIEGYKKEALTKMNAAIDRIEKTHEENPDMMDKLIEQERNKWNISSRDFNGWNNYIIKRHPKDKWLSEEYTELQKDPELFELYNFINKINSKANDAGYIQNKLYSTFLPFVRKSMAESLAWDFSLSSIMKMGDDLSVRASDVGYGSVNELTGELEHSIPKYYTQDFTQTADGINDYSDVSEDLFKNMILYINHMEKYKYLSEVEGQIQLVKTVESFKDHLNTSLTGDIIYVNGKPQEEKGNDDNEKIFDNFLRALLYEQKYPLSDYDTALNISPKNAVKKAINKLAGREVYPIDENPSALSLVKSMDALNRGFQLKTLGFEFISGAVNLFGANIQLATQAGNYFKGREVAANEGKLIGNSFKNDDDREMFIQLIDIFMPLKDDPSYEKMKASGMSALTRQNFSDMLMYFMRAPEHHVEKSVFLTLLDNSMIVDGRIVNIREFVKNKYKERYASAQDYRSQSKAIETEIEELKKTKSITNTKQLVDGKLVVPGLNLKNYKEVERLKNLTRYISRQATGGMSDSDLNRAGMSIWSKSMMVFKGWIPKLVDTRFGEFRKVGDDFSVIIDENGLTTGEKYDIGRVRLFASFLSFNIIKTISNINDIIQVNENGVLQLDAMYEKFAEDYKKRTGEVLNMSREDFMDLIRTNLRNQVKELTILLAMVGLMLSLGFMAPDDDEDKATKNFFRYSQKVMDKFVGELSFFYNPVEFQKMLSGSTFPALGLFSDIEKFITHFTMETTGLDLSQRDKTPEQVRESAQPVKYAAKMLPITKSLITYLSLFSEEFAKEFDITIQNKSNR